MAADLPVSAKDLISFTPAVYETESEDKRPVYLIAVPSLMGRPRWQRELAAASANHVSPRQITEFMRDAVNALLEGDAKTQALRDLEAATESQDRQASAENNGHTFSDEEKAELGRLVVRLAELGEWAARVWPPYAGLVAQQEYWWSMSRLLAAKHFLRGWRDVTEACASCAGTGKGEQPADAPAEAEAPPCARCDARGRMPLKFKLARDGSVDDVLLEKVPRGDVYDVGLKAMALMRLDNERRKN